MKPGQRGRRFAGKNRGAGKDRTDPIAMLLRCHRKTEANIEALQDAAAAMDTDEDDRGARDTVLEVAGFVETSITRHEQDEELSLFPLLRGNPDAAPILETLAREHVEHQRLHDHLSDIANAIEANRLRHRHLAELKEIADAMQRSYAHHIQLEEGTLFPLARSVLDAEQLQSAAADMQRRRGR